MMMNMKIGIFYLISGLTIVIFNINLSAQEWLKKFVPTQTTLSQVEKITGITPQMERDDQILYKLKSGNLFVGISLGNCIKTTWGKWNVEKGIIIYVIFYPKKNKKPSFYNLESEGMTEGFDSGHKTYKNDELGLYYSTQFGKVSGINLYPSNQYKNLKCEN